MSEGGGTPRFVAPVNSIIAEDGDIEPLINRLNQCERAAREPRCRGIRALEGLVGGLLDIYGRFDQPIPTDAT